MSGAEVIAIIGCVAGLIQAYEAASKIVTNIKKKRRERQAPPPSDFLEDAINEGKSDVERLLERGRKRFGPAFEVADDDAINLALYKTTIDIQNALLRCFAQFLEDEDFNNFEVVVYALERSRTQAVAALERLYSQKLDQSVRARESASQNGQAMSPPSPRPMQRTPQAPVRQSTNGAPMVLSMEQRNNLSDAPMVRRLEQRTNTLDAPMVRRLEQRTNTLDAPMVRHLEQRTNSINAPMLANEEQVVTSEQNMASRGPLDNHPRRNRSSQSIQSLTSPSNRASIGSLDTRSQLSTSMTSPHLSPSRSRTDSVKTLSKTPPSPGSSGDFCKYAKKIWTGVPGDGLEISGPSFTCKSKKCGFNEVPAKKNTQNKWVIDTDLRECFGIIYRPLFLAKSHVSTSEGMPCMYRCLICALLATPSDNLNTIQELMIHLDRHRGVRINDVTFRGSIVFENTMRVANEHVFDINLLNRRPSSSTAPLSPSVSQGQSIQEEEPPQYEAANAEPTPFAMDDDNPWAS